MAASGSGGDDAKKQWLECWAQSWHRLQREQLDGYMDSVHQSLNEQHVAMQDVMARLFEKQMQAMQHFLQQPGSFDKVIPNFQYNDINKEIPALNLQQKDVDEDVGEESDGNRPSSKMMLRFCQKQLSQVQLMDMISSVRGAVGWRQASSNEPQVKSLISAPLVPADRVQAFFMRLCHSLAFEFFTAFIVIANTVIIAIDADHALKSSIETGTINNLMSKFVDAIFAAIFLLELICRILAKRCEFFHGSDRWWHAFDILVVGVASAELLFETINFSFIRVLRVFRMMRVFRIIRVFRELRELRVMISSILVSLLTLVWAFVLLTLIMFLFCIVLIQGAAYYIDDHDVVPAQVQDGLESDFSSLSRGMYTLLATISGGKDWTEVAELFWEIHAMYFYIVVFYIVFVLWGVLNVVTAVFVESASNISSIDNDLALQAELGRTESFINQIESLFLELDDDKSGTLEWSEFQEHLEDPRVLAYFASVQIDVAEAKGLFQLLDTDEDGSIAIEEFVLGCMRLKGMAKAIDIAMIMYETKKQAVVNKSNVADLKTSLNELSKDVARNAAAIQKNMRQIHDNTRHIHKNIAQIHHNRSHLDSEGKDSEYGRGESEKRGSPPQYHSTIATDKFHVKKGMKDIVALSNFFHEDMKGQAGAT